jgi:hypothetical protein
MLFIIGNFENLKLKFMSTIRLGDIAQISSTETTQQFNFMNG